MWEGGAAWKGEKSTSRSEVMKFQVENESKLSMLIIILKWKCNYYSHFIKSLLPKIV